MVAQPWLKDRLFRASYAHPRLCGAYPLPVHSQFRIKPAAPAAKSFFPSAPVQSLFRMRHNVVHKLRHPLALGSLETGTHNLEIVSFLSTRHFEAHKNILSLIRLDIPSP